MSTLPKPLFTTPTRAWRQGLRFDAVLLCGKWRCARTTSVRGTEVMYDALLLCGANKKSRPTGHTTVLTDVVRTDSGNLVAG